MSEQALEALCAWASGELGATVAGLDPVAGDASHRRYFRLQAGDVSRIAVLAPPQTEKNREFIAVRSCLERAGLRVPALFAADLERGYLLLEDLGDTLLLPALQAGLADEWYARAAKMLLQLAAASPPEGPWPSYDRALLSEELGRFGEWFVQALLQADPVPVSVYEPFAELLIDNALQQPRVLVHRDFHSRNLMILPGDELAIIDFQDAVLGPVCYDAVSLWRDCYIAWPAERVQAWALEHRLALQREGLLGEVPEETFLRWFDLQGLQRHVKVLGTFARLYLRDDKPAYLEDLPLVLRYTRDILSRYASQEPAVAGFRQWFERELAPRIERSGWARP